MEVKEGVKIYHGVAEVREFEPEKDEFYIFIFINREDKEEIFVEQAFIRNHGQFWNFDDAFRYAKFKKQEGDLNSLFEKYERKRSQLNNIVTNLGLIECEKCGNYHLNNHICYMCGHDRTQ